MNGTAAQASGGESRLRQLFDQEWDFRMQNDPVTATWYGDHRFNDRLPAHSEQDYHRSAQQARAFLAQLQEIDYAELPGSEQLNYDIFKWVLDNQIAGHDFRLHLMPVTRLFGPHTTLPDLIEVTPFASELDYEHYLSRLRAVPAYIHSQIELMRAGMQAGMVPAVDALRGLPGSLRTHIKADPAASVFARPFDRFPQTFSSARTGLLRKTGLDLIEAEVIPAFREFLKFIEGEYLPAARKECGASALPNGEVFYRHCVRRYTSLDLSPEEVHNTGLEEVRRIREEMLSIIREVDFSGSFADFLQFLRTEKRFYAGTPEALLKEAAWIVKRMDGELPRLFKTLPRTPYGLRRTPEHIAPSSYSAYYFPPAGDLSQAGYFYVNTYDLQSRPLYEYEALSFHEAVPGHHLQLALQMELSEVPNFRRFGDMTAFIEGWALYAERLGLGVGFYRDPYSNFGRLTFEMWRACRLVVDTGLHSFHWSRQRAIEYMAENTALSRLNIENEVDRYISWPGQALAYKIGELKIRALRKQAEERLGEAFDLREFHDVLLQQGGIPLSVLETTIENWLNSGV